MALEAGIGGILSVSVEKHKRHIIRININIIRIFNKADIVNVYRSVSVERVKAQSCNSILPQRLFSGIKRELFPFSVAVKTVKIYLQRLSLVPGRIFVSDKV